MGRRSIPIEEIKEERRRHVTFAKRKAGLFKKAMELSILCKSNILLVVFDESKNLYEYCSNEDPRPLLRNYFKQAHLRHERFCDDDYGILYGNEKRSSKTIPLRSNPPLRIQNGREGTEYSSVNRPLPLNQILKTTLPPQPPGMRTGNVLKRSEKVGQPILPKPTYSNNNESFKNVITNRNNSRVQLPPRPQPHRHITPPKKRTPERMRRRRTGFTPLPDHHENYTYTGSTGFTPLPYPSSSEETKIRENQLDQLIQNNKKAEMISRKEGHIEFESPKSETPPPPPSIRPPPSTTSEILMNIETPRMIPPSKPSQRKKGRPALKIDVGGAKRYPLGKSNPSLTSVNSEFQFDTPLTQMFSDDIVKK